jgi:hypothetical protein
MMTAKNTPKKRLTRDKNNVFRKALKNREFANKFLKLSKPIKLGPLKGVYWVKDKTIPAIGI